MPKKLSKSKLDKIKEIYKKISTPEEQIVDLLEQINKEKLKGDAVKTPIKGEDYFTQEEIEEFLNFVTPKKGKDYKDGETPSDEKLVKLIKPLIPDPIPGKDGTVTADDINSKMTAIKDGTGFSVFKLKDVEFLRGKGKDQMQWNSVGGLSKALADTYYQPIGYYLTKSQADTYYAPLSSAVWNRTISSGAYLSPTTPTDRLNLGGATDVTTNILNVSGFSHLYGNSGNGTGTRDAYFGAHISPFTGLWTSAYFEDQNTNIELANNVEALYAEDSSGNTVSLANGTYAINATGEISATSAVFQNGIYGYVTFTESGNVVADFEMANGDIVIIGDGTYALNVSGNSVFDGTLGVTGVRVLKGWFTDLEVTNAPTAGGVAIPTISSTNTLTNKRVTKRVAAYTGNSGTPLSAISTDNYDEIHITGQSTTITAMTPASSTPVSGDTLRINITDNATPVAITWGASFESSTAVLPTTTVGGVRMDLAFVWNIVTSKWRLVGLS